MVQVHVRSLSAKLETTVGVLVNWRFKVQLYAGISVPLATVVASICHVSPALLARAVVVGVPAVPAAASQLIDAVIPAPGVSVSAWPFTR